MSIVDSDEDFSPSFLRRVERNQIFFLFWYFLDKSPQINLLIFNGEWRFFGCRIYLATVKAPTTFCLFLGKTSCWRLWKSGLKLRLTGAICTRFRRQIQFQRMLWNDHLQLGLWSQRLTPCCDYLTIALNHFINSKSQETWNRLTSLRKNIVVDNHSN